MKKTIALILTIILLAGCFFISCNKTENTKPQDTDTQSDETPGSMSTGGADKEKLKVFAMNGPTGISLVKLTSNPQYEFRFEDNAESALPDLIAGKFDIVSIPTNLAATLYQKASGIYKIAAVNTLGVLYMLDSTGSVKSVADLKGKTILSTGEGLVPGFVLEYVLTRNGLEVGKDVNIEYVSKAEDLGQMLLSGDDKIGMLPQPYVTALMAKSEDKLSIVLDMTEEFDKVSGDGTRLMTSCIAINLESLKKKGADIAKIMDDIEASVGFVNENTDDAAKLIAECKIIGSEQIAKKAIPFCKTVFITGNEMKSALIGLYGEMYTFKSGLVGGKLPDEGIFA